MKILWLSHLVPYPPKGGVLQRSYNLFKELCKYNEVDLIAFKQIGLLNTTYANAESGLEDALNNLQPLCNSIKLFDISSDKHRFGKHILAARSLFSKHSYTINWLISKELNNFLANNTERYDLVHFDTISLAPYLKYFKNSKTVLDHHNIESHMMLRRATEEINPLKKFYFWLEGKKLLEYERKICKKFDLNITCSYLDTERLLEIDSSLNATDIPNGVDVNYFKPQKPTKQISGCRLIFAGRLTWYPNKSAVEFFIKSVWPLVKQEFPDMDFDLVGYGPSKLMQLTSQNDPHFHAHGFVDDVRTYIDNASIYVCPITDGGGTKLKILDALAMGKAIVADPIACEGIEVKDNESVLFASTPQQYLDAIKKLVNDTQLRANLSEAARTLAVNKYGYDAIGKNMHTQYKKIVSNNN